MIHKFPKMLENTNFVAIIRSQLSWLQHGLSGIFILGAVGVEYFGYMIYDSVLLSLAEVCQLTLLALSVLTYFSVSER